MIASMKQLLALAPIALLLSGCVANDMWSEAPGDYRYANSAPVPWWGQNAASVDLFYDSLSPYGRWVDYGTYGRVFLPAGVGSNWRPYSRGYWVNDRYGRRWMSQEPFGWATYHYGRWGNDPRLGWFWVPGTQFSSAWVDWRYSDGYASWAPMAPIGWDRFGYYGNDWWISAPSYYLWRPGLYNHIRPGRPDHNWPGMNRPDRPNHPDRPDVNRPAHPDHTGMGRPDRPDRPGARPDRPHQSYPGYRNPVDPPPSNIGRPPREHPQGFRPSGSRPEAAATRPMRPDASAMRPAPQPRPQMERAAPPAPRNDPAPHRGQGREPAPRVQDQ